MLQELKNIKVPMFFAQGGKDYQVTETDFNLWKKQLGNTQNVNFKLYPTLNHIFTKTASEVSSPKDYEIKGKVDNLLISDVADFILK